MKIELDPETLDPGLDAAAREALIGAARLELDEALENNAVRLLVFVGGAWSRAAALHEAMGQPGSGWDPDQLYTWVLHASVFTRAERDEWFEAYADDPTDCWVMLDKPLVQTGGGVARKSVLQNGPIDELLQASGAIAYADLRPLFRGTTFMGEGLYQRED